MRPATLTTTGFKSIVSRSRSSYFSCSSAATCARMNLFGNAMPFSRHALSFALRSAMIWFSSSTGGSLCLLIMILECVAPQFILLNALLQARGNKNVEIAVQHRLGVADLDIGAQILDA